MSAIVAGVDVGASTKGFHAVALSGDGAVDVFASRDPASIAEWCRAADARIVAVDAPCRWREGSVRAAEKEMMAAGISCFWTPTQAQAQTHPKDYYAWTRMGMELYRALASTQPPARSVETFPHAVTCALAGSIVRARDKRRIRTSLLQRAGLDCRRLSSIDLIDAALCALTARFVANGLYRSYGDVDSGLIFVPAV